MKKTTFFLLCAMAFGMLQAQTVSKTTMEQYQQLAALRGQSFKTVGDKLLKWGFVQHDNVNEMLAMQLHQYYRSEGQDTVMATLGVINDVVYSLGGVILSKDATRIYPLISKAGDMQQQQADNLGLTKYVCSVKGKDVKNKFPKSHAELVQMLAEASEATVSWVYESWKSDDGKTTMTCIYNNNLFDKKKPRQKDHVELNVGIGIIPER